MNASLSGKGCYHVLEKSVPCAFASTLILATGGSAQKTSFFFSRNG